MNSRRCSVGVPFCSQARFHAAGGGAPGTPPRCVSNCSTVTVSYCLFILPFNSGNTSAILVSQRNLPSSINMAVSVAVIDLVSEPIWNTSLVVTGAGSPHLRTPTAVRPQILPSFTTTTASAGRSCFLRMTSSAWVISLDAVGAADKVTTQTVKAETSRMLNRISFFMVLFKVSQQCFQFLAARFQTFPHGEAVQPVDSPVNQDDNQCRNYPDNHCQKACISRVPSRVADGNSQSRCKRQQIPPKNIFQEPNLVVDLKQRTFNASFQGII